MSGCDFDLVLYFYDEMDVADRARAAAHLRDCAPCRQRLADLHAIRRALSDRSAVDAPPAGDWSGFMRRLDAAVGVSPARSAVERPAVLERQGTNWSVRQLVPIAAMLALVAIGVVMAAKFRTAGTAQHTGTPATTIAAAPVMSAPATSASATPEQALREITAEHLERSKLVVLGLSTRDPEQTTAADWLYERKLAGALLDDTRVYRLAAQDRGVTDVARVMRDLETVLLEASLSDNKDKDALGRVQRLIAKRDLVVKMQVVTGSAGL